MTRALLFLAASFLLLLASVHTAAAQCRGGRCGARPRFAAPRYVAPQPVYPHYFGPAPRAVPRYQPMPFAYPRYFAAPAPSCSGGRCRRR